MEKIIQYIDDKECVIYSSGEPECLLIQPIEEHMAASLDRQTEMIRSGTDHPFLFLGFRVGEWNAELSPWEAPPVFGSVPFGSGAGKTLRFLIDRLIPSVAGEYLPEGDIPVILGGYSLAAFFALWSAYQTNLFAAIAAVSPSVWFPGWIGFAETHAPLSDNIYLSLGDKEERGKNKVMAAVGDCIRTQQKLLTAEGITNTLEWNKGNHFHEPDVRCAKGFIWCVNRVLSVSG